MPKLCGKVIVYYASFTVKGGNAIHFTVATEGVLVDDTEFFLLTFKKVEEKELESEEVAVEEEDILG